MLKVVYLSHRTELDDFLPPAGLQRPEISTKHTVANRVFDRSLPMRHPCFGNHA
jgi:hypothetical protein